MSTRPPAPIPNKCDVTRLSHVAILVPDRARARDWYVDVFGMEIVYDTEASTMLRLPQTADRGEDAAIVLGDLAYGFDHPAEPPKPRKALDPDELARRAQSGLQVMDHLGFNVQSRAVVDRMAAEAERRGDLLMPPVANDYLGYMAYLRDPAGNRVEIVTYEGLNRW